MQSALHTVPCGALSADFARAYLTTMRPYLMFVSGITGLVGMSFIPEIDITKASLLFISCFLSYGFGQALTDCFQVDTDSLSAPYRPLTRGIISKKQVLVVSVLGLLLCTTVFAFYNPWNLLLGSVAGLGLATYTPFKRKWWGGPFYNAWIVAVLCTMAFAAGDANFFSGLSTSFVLALAAVFFGYSNFVLAGYFKDIYADRQTDYRTLPVVFGRRVSAFVSDGFAVLALAPAIVLLIGVVGTHPVFLSVVPAIAFGTAGLIASAVAQIRLHRVVSDDGAHSAIGPVVHSYILVLSSIACMRKPEWAAFLTLFYAGFVMVLKIRPARNQI
ncbi:MAG: UbiA family prenyltransferase [Bacteroidota bacterium]|jgi:4-hydroxybenzoate polyprenyltransferase